MDILLKIKRGSRISWNKRARSLVGVIAKF